MPTSVEALQRSVMDRGSSSSSYHAYTSTKHYAETTRALGIVRKAVEAIIRGPEDHGVVAENRDVDQELEDFVQLLAEIVNDSLTLARLRAEKRRKLDGNSKAVDRGGGAEDGELGNEACLAEEKKKQSWMVAQGFLAPLDGQLQAESYLDEKMEKMVEERMKRVLELESQRTDHAKCRTIFDQGINYTFSLLEMEGRSVLKTKLEVSEALEDEKNFERAILRISRDMIASGHRTVDEIVKDSRRLNKKIIALSTGAYEQGVRSQVSKSPTLSMDNVHVELVKLCGQAEDPSQPEYSMQAKDTWDDVSVGQLRPWGDIGHYDHTFPDENGFYLEDPMILEHVRAMRRLGIRHEDYSVTAHHADKDIKLPFLGWMPIPWKSYQSWSFNTTLQDTSGNRRLMYERKDMDIARIQELSALKARWALQDQQYLERYKRHVVYNPDWLESGRITSDFSHHPMFVQQPLVEKQHRNDKPNEDDDVSDQPSTAAPSGIAQRRGKFVPSLTVDNFCEVFPEAFGRQRERRKSTDSVTDNYPICLRGAEDISDRIEELLGDLELKKQEDEAKAVLEASAAGTSTECDVPIPDMTFANNHYSESSKNPINESLSGRNRSYTFAPTSPLIHDLTDFSVSPASPDAIKDRLSPSHLSPFILLSSDKLKDKPLPNLPPPGQNDAESIHDMPFLKDTPADISANTILPRLPRHGISTVGGSSFILINQCPMLRPSIECMRLYARAIEDIHGLERTSKHAKLKKMPTNHLSTRILERGESDGVVGSVMAVKATEESLRRAKPLGAFFDTGSVKSQVANFEDGENSTHSRDENRMPTPLPVVSGTPRLLVKDGEEDWQARKENVVSALKRRDSFLKQAKKKVQKGFRASLCGSIEEGSAVATPVRVASPPPMKLPKEQRLSEVSILTSPLADCLNGDWLSEVARVTE